MGRPTGPRRRVNLAAAAADGPQERASMTQPRQAPIVSEFADEPEMLELIAFFAAEMPGWVERIEAAWEGQRRDDLRRLAHQLKGAAGGYGFSLIGDTAAELEERLGEEPGEPELEEIRELVDSLVDLCRRVRAD